MFGQALNEELLVERCQAVMRDPRAFGAAIVDNLPLALFLALPLLALVAKILALDATTSSICFSSPISIPSVLPLGC